tara:strand:+ start:452 stop:2728 length:2277 start_codon:yes stop_codon:yes gene_type:complete
MSGIGKIVYVKISRTDGNGTDITNALESLENIVLPLSTGNKELNILNRTRENEYFLFYVSMAGTENIPAADKSSPNYSFSSSFQNQYDQPSDSSPNLTVTLDNHNFFLPGGTGLGLGPSHEPLDSYRITTLPAKNIGVHVSSSYNSFFQASGKYGSAHITASVRILSSPLSPGITPTSPTVLAESVFTGSFLNLATTDFVYSGSGFEIFTIISASQWTPGDCLYFDVHYQSPEFGQNMKPKNATFINGIFELSSSAAVVNSRTLSIEPYFTSPFYGTDCDVMYGDISQGVLNPFLQDIDYSTDMLTPVNYLAIQDNTATKASVPESYYTSLAQTNIRYNGSKIQSKEINSYIPGNYEVQGLQLGMVTLKRRKPFNIGNYGKTAAIDSLDTNIYEFEWGGGTSPEIVGWGALKMGKILNVQTPDSVRTINPSEGLTQIVRPFGKTSGANTISTYRKLVGENLPAGLYIPLSSSVSTGSVGSNHYWKISQSVSDYYYTLNNNNPVNSEISLQMYPNPTAGSNPTIPNSTKIATTDFGVPTISNYALTSSNSSVYGNFTTSGGGFGLIQLNRSIHISKLTTDSNGFYQSAPYPIKPNWATIGDEMVMSLNKGERWFITLFNEFEFPAGQGDYNSVLTTGSLSPFNEGYTSVDSNGDYPNPLASRGVYEIIGNWDQFSPYFYLLLDTPKGLPGSKNIGGGVPGNSLGMLIWKARDTGENKFVIVQDNVTGGVSEGAFTSKYTPNYVTENFEQLTKTFGSNQT